MNVDYMTHSGSDLLVVNAARCSFSKESSELNDADKKLINYLAREKHWLPFRHPTVTFRCKAPLFVARQLGKHQTGMSWSEESRRYIKTKPELYWPKYWREAADKVKQGSSDERAEWMHENEEDWSNYDWIHSLYSNTIVEFYEDMLKNGVAPEQARMILPQNMYINWVWTGTLLAWGHLFKQRTDSHAQRECQDFAWMIDEHMRKLYPESWAAIKEYL